MNLMQKVFVGAGLIGALALGCATAIPRKDFTDEISRQLTKEELACIGNAECNLSEETLDKLRKIYREEYKENSSFYNNQYFQR